MLNRAQPFLMLPFMLPVAFAIKWKFLSPHRTISRTLTCKCTWILPKAPLPFHFFPEPVILCFCNPYALNPDPVSITWAPLPANCLHGNVASRVSCALCLLTCTVKQTFLDYSLKLNGWSHEWTTCHLNATHPSLDFFSLVVRSTLCPRTLLEFHNDNSLLTSSIQSLPLWKLLAWEIIKRIETIKKKNELHNPSHHHTVHLFLSASCLSKMFFFLYSWIQFANILLKICIYIHESYWSIFLVSLARDTSETYQKIVNHI